MCYPYDLHSYENLIIKVFAFGFTYFIAENFIAQSRTFDRILDIMMISKLIFLMCNENSVRNKTSIHSYLTFLCLNFDIIP